MTVLASAAPPAIPPAMPPAGKHFDFNPACQEAYRAITQLRLEAGQKILDAEKRRDPGNLIPAFLENYIDFFVLFFNEDPAQYEIRKKMLDRRIGLMSEGPEDSPFNLFTRSVIHFQWAAIKIKFGSSLGCGLGVSPFFHSEQGGAKEISFFSAGADVGRGDAGRGGDHTGRL